MSRTYYKNGWEICGRETVYGSWKDGSDIYKDKKGYYVIQYEPKKDMVYKKHIKFTAGSQQVFTQKIKSKKYQHCLKTKTRKQKK